MAVELDVELVRALQKGEVPSTIELAKQLNADHQALIGTVASLGSEEVVVRSAPKKSVEVKLTAEGSRFAAEGVPEARVFALVKDAADGLTEAEVAASYPEAKLGLKFCMKDRVLAIDKATKKYSVTDKAEGWKSQTAQDIELVNTASSSQADKEAAAKRLGSRKLAVVSQASYFALTKGANFPQSETDIEKRVWRIKKPADFTADQLREMWKTGEVVQLKKANLNALGTVPDSGNLHPLMKLRQQYREIFLELGFQEMDTARFVDSSFWNFDTLFVPQQHPARDAQDTFFVCDPAATTSHPKDYLEETAKVHGEGMYGSTGYKYKFSQEETEKNVLRTHTTSISSYTLYNIGQEYKRTGKLATGAYFSIDRVFRNEDMDKTHLCEFHQMEGFVLDYDLSLSNMMALLKAFFERVGVTGLMFKPAYNPYTEPSMEIHTEQNGKIMEVGNSGMFRPEMLRPMGLPEGVTAIAWGLGLERVAMRHYKLPSVHDLFGHKVSVPFVKNAAAPRI